MSAGVVAIIIAALAFFGGLAFVMYILGKETYRRQS